MTPHRMPNLPDWLTGAGVWAGRWLHDAWAWMLSSPRMDVLLGYIGLQVGLIVLLVAYALLLRALREVRRRRRERLYTAWHYLVPAFLLGELDATYLRHSIRRRDFPLFFGFLRPYLLDLAGSDAQHLIGFLADLGIQEYLARRLRSRWKARRAAAAHDLGLMAGPWAIPLLREALNDPAEPVVVQATEALMRLQDFESIVTALRRVSGFSGFNRQRVSLYLMEAGPEILPALQQQVRALDTPPWLAVQELDVLAHHRHVAATWDVLDLYTRTNNREVRIACAKTLATLGEPTLVGLFEEMLDDPDPVVRSQGAIALGKIGGPQHAQRLVSLLRSDNYWLLQHAVTALDRIGALEQAARDVGQADAAVSPRAREVIREVLAQHRSSRPEHAA